MFEPDHIDKRIEIAQIEGIKASVVMGRNRYTMHDATLYLEREVHNKLSPFGRAGNILHEGLAGEFKYRKADRSPDHIDMYFANHRIDEFFDGADAARKSWPIRLIPPTPTLSNWMDE